METPQSTAVGQQLDVETSVSSVVRGDTRLLSKVFAIDRRGLRVDLDFGRTATDERPGRRADRMRQMPNLLYKTVCSCPYGAVVVMTCKLSVMQSESARKWGAARCHVCPGRSATAVSSVDSARADIPPFPTHAMRVPLYQVATRGQIEGVKTFDIAWGSNTQKGMVQESDDRKFREGPLISQARFSFPPNGDRTKDSE